MADKVLTATQLAVGRLGISWDALGDPLDDSAGAAVVTVTCPYQFCDSGGNILPISGGTQVLSDQITNLDANIQTALIDLAAHMETLALATEGM